MMSLNRGTVIFQENNPSFNLVIFAASWELFRYSHKKMNEDSYKNYLFRSFSSRMWAVARKNSKYGYFLNVFCYRTKIRQLLEARWRLTVGRDIFILTKTLAVNKYMLWRRQCWRGWHRQFNEWKKWKKLHSFQGRTERIFWNKFRYSNQ